MNERELENYREQTKNMVPYNFPRNRECHWCKKQKPRPAGRWVTKTTWVCHDCIKKEREND